MPRVTISFNLPAESAEHRDALDGTDWKCAVTETDNTLRNWIKHGHTFKTATEALEAARNVLNREAQIRGLEMYE